MKLEVRVGVGLNVRTEGMIKDDICREQTLIRIEYQHTLQARRLGRDTESRPKQTEEENLSEYSLTVKCKREPR